MESGVNITGTEELVKAMENLPPVLRKKLLIRAMRKGGRVVKDKAVQKINEITSESEVSKGLLAKSIVIRKLKNVNGNLRVAISIAAKKFAQNGARVGLYGSVLELGKENQKPQPFMQPAIKESPGQALSAITKEIKDGLPKAIEEAKRGS